MEDCTWVIASQKLQILQIFYDQRLADSSQKDRERDRLTSQCTVPIEKIVWMDAFHLVKAVFHRHSGQSKIILFIFPSLFINCQDQVPGVCTGTVSVLPDLSLIRGSNKDILPQSIKSKQWYLYRSHAARYHFAPVLENRKFWMYSDTLKTLRISGQTPRMAQMHLGFSNLFPRSTWSWFHQ